MLTVCLSVCLPAEKHMHILDNIRELKMMMSGVGAVETETPGGLDIFDSTQAKKIADYFHTTYGKFKFHIYIRNCVHFVVVA